MLRVRAIVLFGVAVMVLTGCRVDAEATTIIRADGSGEVVAQVTLDPEAVQAVEAGGGTLEARIVTTDLGPAGWAVAPWERRPDGSASLVARKGFARPEDVGAIYREMSGDNGPFRNVSASMRDGIITTDWAFTGSLDRKLANAGVTDDPQLAQKITSAGFDPASVQTLLSSAVGASVGVVNRVELPGGTVKTWTAAPGETVAMNAEASRFDSGRGLIAIGGGALIIFGFVLFIASEARARRVRRRSGGARP